MTSTVTLNTSGLEEFWGNMLATLDTAVKVGVLRSTNARDDGDTNAEVGLKNEFGDPQPSASSRAQEEARGRGTMAWESTPQRSFLRMPLLEQLPKEIEFNTPLLRHVVEDAIPGLTLAEAIGTLAVQTVDSAFETKGFGQWPSNSPRTVQWKNSDRPLIDSSQLRESIRFETVPA